MSEVAATDALTRIPATETPRFLRRLVARPIAALCLAYFTLLVAIAVLAPFVLPEVEHENAGDLLNARQGPSWDHILGTDQLGRDVFQRLLVGTRPTLVGVGEAMFVALLLGVSLGLASGYFGGRLDRIMSRGADIVLSLPAIVLIFVVLTVFEQSLLAGMVTFGLLVAPGVLRIVRSAVLPVREELYIAAARVSGLPHRYIVTRHVLPRVAGPVIVQASLVAASALLVQTGLAFLGLVTPAPEPSWGGMVADGLSVIVLQPWLIWPPGVAITLTVIAFGLLGDAVRDTTVETWTSYRSPVRKPARATTTHDDLHQRSDSLLIVEDLAVSFNSPAGQRIRVVDGVSFAVSTAEIVGIVGESGCGKTATAMAVLGLLPGTGQVDRGQIRFDGVDLTALAADELQKVRGNQIALISQEPMASLNPVFKVGSQLAEVVRRHHSVSRKAARGRVLELLRLVRLPEPEAVVRRYPHELSGGMAQRVAIARALAGDPRLLLADEPTTALDVTVEAEILDLLRELCRARGMSVVIVTHDLGVIADICDRAIVMYAGHIVEQGEIVPIFQRPLHPYTESLLAANPHHHSTSGTVLPTLAGGVPQPGFWPDGCRFNPRCPYATLDCTIAPIPIKYLSNGRQTRCIHHELLAERAR